MVVSAATECYTHAGRPLKSIEIMCELPRLAGNDMTAVLEADFRIAEN